MANIKSAKKRILVQAKREAQNKAFRTNLKTVIKRANAAKGIIHKNCAARKKSTLVSLAK